MALRETIAEIHLTALEKNVRQVEKQIGARKIIAVVKADAYGHGAVAISKHLIKVSPQVSMLGVASLDEGLALRKAGIKIPILLMTGCPADGIPELFRHRLTPALFDESTLFLLGRYAKKAGCKMAVHLKVDTGMGRLGLLPSEAIGFAQKAMDNGVTVEGLFSHFSDADLSHLSYARLQLAKLIQIKTALEEKIPLPYCHLANSAAIIHFAPAHLNQVRPGLMLYGYSPLQSKGVVSLCPSLTVKAQVIAVKKVAAGTAISYGRTFVTKRKTTVAVIAIGYADGYPRSLSNVGEMLAKGRRVKVIGRVCMDMTMLDVTAVPSLSVGDWVTVIGKEGKEVLWADELAQKANTLVYEILCGIRRHIPRVYLTG